MKILVTGAAGFIGAHTTAELAKRGHAVVCIDDFNDAYDPELKKARVRHFLAPLDISVQPIDIRDRHALDKVFAEHQIDAVCHLAARAGVRASFSSPDVYTEVNVTGTVNLLECARRSDRVRHFVFASSSSVYGGATKVPFAEDDPVDHPVSVYAATKKAGELLCNAYASAYQLSCTCLRFFTVYGPFGRPDMAYFSFTDRILRGEPIRVYNYGKHKRDFTYIDDIVSGIVAAVEKPMPFEIINLGNSKTVSLERFISVIEDALGKTAKKEMLPMQPGDVPQTFADITKAKSLLGYSPTIDIEDGIRRFVAWYREYYKK